VRVQVPTGYNGVKASPYVGWLDGINSSETDYVSFLEVMGFGMCVPSEVRQDPLRDFLRFDHASEDAIPNMATTTPATPMIASVDNW
jgi:hypothetical protein